MRLNTEFIKKELKARDYLLQDLVHIFEDSGVDVSINAVKSWTRKTSPSLPTTDKLLLLADFFDTNVEALLVPTTDEDEPIAKRDYESECRRLKEENELLRKRLEETKPKTTMETLSKAVQKEGFLLREYSEDNFFITLKLVPTREKEV